MSRLHSPAPLLASFCVLLLALAYGLSTFIPGEMQEQGFYSSDILNFSSMEEERCDVAIHPEAKNDEACIEFLKNQGR